VKPFLVALMVLAGSSLARAATPIIWKQDTQAAFAKGDAKSVTITRDGALRLGPSLSEFADTGEPFVWSIASSGETVYAGTGGEGRVYRLTSGASELLFDSPERAIFSVAVAKSGTVYAGSSPGGLIYEIPSGGEPRTFARTGDEHVWALIPDGSGGLYAATGGQAGRILHISKAGEVSEIAKTSDPNFSSLIRSSDGTLYAGTDQNGLVYRVSSSGQADVLYDTSEEEVKTLAMAPDGRLLAGAMSSSRPAPQRPPQGAKVSNGGQAGGQSAVYAIKPSGSGWRLWDVPSPSIHALSVQADGSVLVVTGGKGHIYRLHGDGSHTVVTTVDDAEPWAFAPDGKGGGWIASSGSGQVFRLGHSVAREGSLTSEPEDFSLVTQWGRIDWAGESTGGGGVAFEVRTGNSDLPDDTWSAWETVAANGKIVSRAARYVQQKVTLTGDGKQTPVIRSVTLSGLPENIQPLILDLQVRGPNDPAASAPSGSNGGRKPTKKKDSTGGWVITWTGADVNNDALVYALHFKGRTERTWKLLEDDLTGNSYTWQTDSAPEGIMLVRLSVSDSPSNPDHLTLSSTRESAPFVIDHGDPAVRIASVETNAQGQVVISGSIVDESSAIKASAYSLNSGDWQVVFPADDIFDSREEVINLTLSGLAPGEYTLVIRAVDTVGNVGVAKRVFDVK
jgi:hypothetical protein